MNRVLRGKFHAASVVFLLGVSSFSVQQLTTGKPRKTLEEKLLVGATIRRKLAALASLLEHLCKSDAVTHNPVKGVRSPVVESRQEKTPAKILSSLKNPL
ncbi:MAG: hypothetical protein ABJA60_11365 [Nitrosospira sp.]